MNYDVRREVRREVRCEAARLQLWGALHETQMQHVIISITKVMFWWIVTSGHDATLPRTSNSVTSQNTPRRTSEFIKTIVSYK